MPASSSTHLMHACLGQDLRIHGRRSGRTQVVRLDVLPTVCKFTGLTALWLESSDLFLLTPGSITALAPLHQLSSLHTSLWAAPSEQPMDLAEYAHVSVTPSVGYSGRSCGRLTARAYWLATGAGPKRKLTAALPASFRTERSLGRRQLAEISSSQAKGTSGTGGWRDGQ